MTEPKPAQQYETVASPPGDTALSGPPTIDEQSRQAAMARALVEREMTAREQACGIEVREAINKIAERHNCVIQFIETRINGQVAEIGFRSVAVERLKK